MSRRGCCGTAPFRLDGTRCRGSGFSTTARPLRRLRLFGKQVDGGVQNVDCSSVTVPRVELALDATAQRNRTAKAPSKAKGPKPKARSLALKHWTRDWTCKGACAQAQPRFTSLSRAHSLALQSLPVRAGVFYEAAA